MAEKVNSKPKVEKEEEIPVREEEYKGTKVIHLFPEYDGEEAVWCAINGKTYMVKTDEDVEVPYEVWSNLSNSRKALKEAKEKIKKAEKEAIERSKNI